MIDTWTHVSFENLWKKFFRHSDSKQGDVVLAVNFSTSTFKTRIQKESLRRKKCKS